MENVKRKQYLIKLSKKLDDSKNVTNLELKRGLTTEELKEYRTGWESEKASRKVIRPIVLDTYTKYFKKGTMLYNRKEAMVSRRSSEYEIKKITYAAESCFERALETANELVSTDGSCLLWFDRDPRNADFSCPEEMPHLRINGKDGVSFDGTPILRIRDYKRIVIQEALDRLESNTSRLKDCYESINLWKIRKPAQLDTTDFKF